MAGNKIIGVLILIVVVVALLYVGRESFKKYFLNIGNSDKIAILEGIHDGSTPKLISQDPKYKSAIAINNSDARPSRWTGGEKLDCAIAEIDLSKRKVTLSIKLLEEIEKKEALEKYGSEGSGKNLPFSSLSEDLKKKDK